MARAKRIEEAPVVVEETPAAEPVIEEAPIAEEVVIVPAPTEKDRLLALYQTLIDLNVRSISDLENLIARTE